MRRILIGGEIRAFTNIEFTFPASSSSLTGLAGSMIQFPSMMNLYEYLAGSRSIRHTHSSPSLPNTNCDWFPLLNVPDQNYEVGFRVTFQFEGCVSLQSRLRKDHSLRGVVLKMYGVPAISSMKVVSEMTVCLVAD